MSGEKRREIAFARSLRLTTTKMRAKSRSKERMLKKTLSLSLSLARSLASLLLLYFRARASHSAAFCSVLYCWRHPLDALCTTRIGADSSRCLPGSARRKNLRCQSRRPPSPSPLPSPPHLLPQRLSGGLDSRSSSSPCSPPIGCSASLRPPRPPPCTSAEETPPS